MGNPPQIPPPPDGQNPPSTAKQLFSKYGWWGIALIIALVIFFVGRHFLSVSTPPPVHITDMANADVAQLISDDAEAFHRMYKWWTGIDWALTFFAAGTAVAATMKNTYAVKQDKQDSPSWLDVTLMVLAILAVLASTFDAKLHASQLATAYRRGDIVLQKAKMAWADSKKDDAAKKDLLDQWNVAESYLEPNNLGQSQGATTPPAQAPNPPNGTTGRGTAAPNPTGTDHGSPTPTHQ